MIRGTIKYKGDKSQWGEVAVPYGMIRKGLTERRHSSRDKEEKAMQVSRKREFQVEQ